MSNYKNILQQESLRPVFSIVYTTRRAPISHRVIELWLKRAVAPQNVEIIIAVDGNDQVGIEFMNGVGRSYPCKWVVQPNSPFNCVRGWNTAAEHATGKVMIVISDDFVPPHNWDQQLLMIAQGQWLDGEYVIRVNDGYTRNLCTMPILTRKRYERFGYVFYPFYESIYCDTELTQRAEIDGVLIDAPHLIFEHQHPDNHKRTQDSVDLVHNSPDRWKRGKILFDHRAKLGFPIDVGPNANRVPVKRRYAAYVQCTRDDFCLYEVCKRVAEEGIEHFFFCVPDEYWSGKPTPSEDIEEIRSITQSLQHNLKVFVDLRIFHTQNYRSPGLSRIQVETRLRNDSINWIRAQGFNDIIILDGDELWVPGLLSELDTELARMEHRAVACGMIPVIGLPGFPVDNAQDRVTIYIGGDTPFRECRSPASSTRQLDTYGVIHFTACRKTMQEIIDKHRNSGHGDDPDYDMEGWIKRILPNARPGMKNVHMYKKFQIWPEIRNWTETEISHIPVSLWPYLGIDMRMTAEAKPARVDPLKFVSELTQPKAEKVCTLGRAVNVRKFGHVTR